MHGVAHKEQWDRHKEQWDWVHNGVVPVEYRKDKYSKVRYLLFQDAERDLREYSRVYRGKNIPGRNHGPTDKQRYETEINKISGEIARRVKDFLRLPLVGQQSYRWDILDEMLRYEVYQRLHYTQYLEFEPTADLI